jgi:outer membrane protein
MKNVVKLALGVIFLLSTAFGSFAQVKIGFIDSKKLLAQMPAMDSANKKMEKEQATLKDQLDVLQVELNNKYKAYQDNDQLEKGNSAKWTDLIKADKENELRSLNERVQTFQNNAQSSLQQKQTELFEPILKKVDNAIKKISASGGFTLVVDPNATLYVSPSQCTDITDLVKKELGLIK